jgi:hypothetical protein
MKKIIALFCLVCFLGVTTPAQAAIKVKANTVVPITLEKLETSKTVMAGGTVNAIIAEDVIVDNVVVFKEGDKASLNIISAKKAGFVGIPGEITVSGGKVFDTKGVAHRVDYTTQIEGEEKTWPKVMLGCGVFIILAPLALFGFVKGGQAKMLPATVIDTRITSEFTY